MRRRLLTVRAFGVLVAGMALSGVFQQALRLVDSQPVTGDEALSAVYGHSKEPWYFGDAIVGLGGAFGIGGLLAIAWLAAGVWLVAARGPSFVRLVGRFVP